VRHDKDGAKKVSDWTEKRVSLPTQAKSATAARSRQSVYNVIMQSQDEHQRQQTTGLFRRFTGASLERLPTDPFGPGPPELTTILPALPPRNTTVEPSPRPFGFIPIPYPIIPNESVEDEAARFTRLYEDSERRYHRAQQSRSSSASDHGDPDDMPHHLPVP
jgi:hypothetical protein